MTIDSWLRSCAAAAIAGGVDWARSQRPAALSTAQAWTNRVALTATQMLNDAIGRADFGLIGNHVKPELLKGLDQAVGNLTLLVIEAQPQWFDGALFAAEASVKRLQA